MGSLLQRSLISNNNEDEKWKVSGKHKYSTFFFNLNWVGISHFLRKKGLETQISWTMYLAVDFRAI